MSQFKSLQKIKEVRAVDVLIVMDEESMEQFPIGNVPTWEEIGFTITHYTTLLILDYCSPCCWQHQYSGFSCLSEGIYAVEVPCSHHGFNPSLQP